MGRRRDRDRPKPASGREVRDADAPPRDDVERALRDVVDRLKPKPGKGSTKRKP